ncbi:MAG: tryptophan synthase subunit alpha [Acidobacteria bacterium RIFCSPHIGHO2_12_FULL_67_30]|nr:MAG: tryptophan synthase subunit alpha [Acidobacteria bacterium RIFCSPHIGHO2_02_FULL_67_57]OFV83959.1 MAG: tryptophan synthase subunit alpha [Acidobacteria bacterium RIFCSPHIGHO2_01_FULL_67_28]OFV88793.1 MAG: tryptophan synthase subunit alpha [Acidobacteria bacterium RIFCSPHIGHO2_12_FULL_67_30]
MLRAKSNGLRAAFRRGKRRGPALVAYVTAGDPSLKFTEKLVLRMAEAGADVVELGVPFSDPIADGPVIQRASERALKAGTTLPGVLKLAERLRRKSAVPLVLFSYYNPVLQMGVERFAARAAAAGVSGVLITDLTPEEAGEFVRTLRRHKLDTVFLAAPTSSNGRLRSIARLSRGFVYLIARRGVTGAPTEVGGEIKGLVKRLRRSTRLPVAVGFGISRPQQVAALDGLVDGVVVGSALVQCCEQTGHGPAALEAAAELVRTLKEARR